MVARGHINKWLSRRACQAQHICLPGSIFGDHDHGVCVCSLTQATYLATMTKGSNSINDLIDKYNVAFERQSRRRGLF